MTSFLPAGGRIEGLGSFATTTLDELDTLESRRGRPIHVGVVDTGIVVRDGVAHPFIATHLDFPVVEIDRVPEDDPLGSRGHGTFVTGLIVNEAPTASVQMRAALNTGNGEAEDNAVAAAIYDLAHNGIQLVNLSFCGDAWEVGTPSAIANAIAALGPDAVVIAAAGNLGQSRPFYPGGMPSTDDGPEIVAVGALAKGEQPRVAGFSNHGETVRVYADGEELLGPYGAAEWARWSGTSFASAVVTGKVAAYLAAHPDDTPRTALGHIMAEADKIDVFGVNGVRQVPAVRAAQTLTQLVVTE